MSSIQRRIALAIGAALAVMAFVVPSAMAATQVKDAKTGTLCSAVSPAISPKTAEEELNLFFHPPEYTSGGCTVHMTYAFKNELIPPGASVTSEMFSGFYETCNINYDIHVGPNGWGYANKFQFKTTGVWNCPWFPGLAGNIPKESQIIAPKESNPYGIVFKHGDANTDLNAFFGAHKACCSGGWTAGQEGISLDVTNANPLVLDNQYDHNDPNNQSLGNGSFREGAWEGNAGLTITH